MKWPEMKTLCQIALVILILLAAQHLSAGVYYWIDEKGVKHYSNVTPSETGKEIQQQEEIPQEAPKAGSPSEPIETDPQGTTGTEGEIKAEESGGPASEETVSEEKKASAEDESAEAAPEEAEEPIQVYTSMGEIVQSEKSAARGLQRQLEQNAAQRDDFIDNERARLNRIIEELQKTPVSKFGTFDNKRRAIGYYRYRQDSLQNAPDEYFMYGDSDIN